MKHLAIIAATVGVLSLAACTEAQQNTARAVAAASIDAACANLPNMDAQFATVAPRANGSAKAAYASAKATLQSVCDNRPLDKPEQQLRAVTAAVTKIAAIVGPLLVDAVDR